MQIERFCFPGAGGAELAGVVRRPEGPVQGSALIAHCFTCGKDIHTTARLAKRLTAAGWLTMTFDFTGLGESGGSFGDQSVGTNVGDLTRAAVALIERNAGPCLLIGHSLGGAAAVLAAARVKTVDRIIAIAAPSDVEHVRHLFDDAPVRADGSVDAHIGGRPFRIGAEFQEDLARHDVIAAAASLERPFLVVEAGADTIVGAEQTARLAAAGGADVATIPDADHLFGGAEAGAALADTVLDWLDRT
ncbi:MAG: alpha/beta fold hydrolase [Actinomycetota bacterium]